MVRKEMVSEMFVCAQHSSTNPHERRVNLDLLPVFWNVLHCQARHVPDQRDTGNLCLGQDHACDVALVRQVQAMNNQSTVKLRKQGAPEVRERYCNLHNYELARDTKGLFGHDVALLVGYMYAKNSPFKHIYS
jgi:hypothetical protein